MFFLVPECSFGFPSVLALRWMMLEKVFGVGVVRRELHFAGKPNHAVVNVDGLSYLVHYPTTYGCRPLL
jgi:hypothetical protein